MRTSADDLLSDYDLVPLEAYDRSKTLIPTRNIARLLKGALLQVTFNLLYSGVPSRNISNFKGRIIQQYLGTVLADPIKLQAADVCDDQVEAVRQFLLPKSLLTLRRLDYG